MLLVAIDVGGQIALGAVDLGGQIDRFLRAAGDFLQSLGRVDWPFLVAALILSLAMQVCRGHAWANALRAAYPGDRVSEVGVVGSGPVRAADPALDVRHCDDHWRWSSSIARRVRWRSGSGSPIMAGKELTDGPLCHAGAVHAG
jgi:hypothetical protein